MPETTNCSRLRLLIWKNFLILKYNRREMLLDIFIPIILWFAVIVMRMVWNPKQIDSVTQEPVDLQKAWDDIMEVLNERREAIKNISNPDHNVFVPQPIIAYAPSDYKDFRDIMKTAVEDLGGNMELRGFYNCHQLANKMSEEHFFAGICFHDVIAFSYATDEDANFEYDDEPLNNLNYTFLLPSELRYYQDSYVGANWETNLIFRTYLRRRYQIDYVREGLVSLQDAIGRAFLKYRKADLPEISLQAFPIIAYKFDEMVPKVRTLCCFFIIWSLLCPIIRFTRRMVEEKEKDLKAYICIMGVSNCVYYLSWFLHGFVILYLNAIVATLILHLTWNEGTAFFTKGSIMVFMIFITAFSIVSTAFCILIAAICVHSFGAAIIAGSVWIMTSIPIITIIDIPEGEKMLWLWVALIPNFTYGYTFDMMINDEILDDGLHWDDMFAIGYPYNHLAVGYVSLLFLGQAIIYFLVALLYEQCRPNNYYCSSTYSNLMRHSMRRQERAPTLKTYESPSTKVFEVDHPYKKLLASFEDLSKLYQNLHAVKRFSMNLYENSITVLMGHNGSGKTTLLSMIIGLVPISEGRIEIDGIDVTSKTREAYPNIGASMRDSLLFKDLTVEHQIRFFSRLKGQTWKQAELEVDKFCRALSLRGKRKVITRRLTPGLRSQLAVCCALTGKSNVVILDEPDYGLDLSASRQVMELLVAEKTKRAILMSNASSSMADMIADRVAILAKGELKCSGSVLFLKNIYSFGQRLYIVKLTHCRTERVTAFLQSFIPDIAVERDVGNSLTYLINNRYTNLINSVLENLELALPELLIETYCIDDLSVHDIVLTMGSNYPNDYDPHRQSRIKNGETPYISAYDVFNRPYTEESGKLHKYRALFLVRFIFYIRSMHIALSLTLIPAIFVFIMYGITLQFSIRPELNAVQFSLSIYEHSTSLIFDDVELDENMKKLSESLKESIYWLQVGNQWKHTEGFSMQAYVQQLQRENFPKFKTEYLLGAAFKNDKIEIFYNPFGFLMIPTALNMAHNMLARALVDKYSTISVYFDPLPYQITVFAENIRHVRNYTNMVLIMMFGFLFTWSASAYLLTLQRQTRLRLLIQIAGTEFRDFWFNYVCFDLLHSIIVTSLISLALWVCRSEYVDGEFVGYTFMALLPGSMCAHAVHYVFAGLIKSPFTCFLVVLIYDCIGIILYMIHLRFCNTIRALQAFDIHPVFAMGHMLDRLYYRFHHNKMCNDPDLQVILKVLQDQDKPDCEEDLSFLSLNGIVIEIIALFLVWTLCWILIYLIEHNQFWLNFWIWRMEPDSSTHMWKDYMHVHTLDEPDDNTREAIEMENLKAVSRSEKALVFSHVGKTFGINEALHRISFAVDKFTMATILGPTGSGKSVLLELICAMKRVSYGRIYVKGVDVVAHPFDVYKNIGYCPDKQTGIDYLTPCEILEIYATLRGIPQNFVPTLCESLAKLLGFFDFYDKIMFVCSPGMQARVGCALSIIGRPDLVLLDTAAQSLDLYGKLMFRNVLARLTNSGSSVILASVSPTESQFYSDKIFVIMNGRMVAGGTMTQVLKGGTYGYKLLIRMKPVNYVNEEYRHGQDLAFHFRAGNSRVLMRLVTLIQNSFEDAVLRSADGLVLIFVLPQHHSIAKIYSTVKGNTFPYNIESFSIFRSSLETVYLDMLAKEEHNRSSFYRRSSF